MITFEPCLSSKLSKIPLNRGHLKYLVEECSSDMDALRRSATDSLS